MATRKPAPPEETPTPTTQENPNAQTLEQAVANLAGLKDEGMSLRDQAPGKDVNGKTRYAPPTEATVKEIAKNRQAEFAKKKGKRLLVKTTSGGRMHYFEADMWITDRETPVPDSPWLQMQIKAGKIKVVED